MSELRLAWRTLSKSPGFTFAAAGLLAAGIGVTTLIFSALDAIVLRPLPVSHPEQLVRLAQRLPRIGLDSRLPLPVYDAIRDRSRTLSAVIGEHEQELAMTEPEPAERVTVHLSTPNFFDALGVHAAIGRVLTSEDEKDAGGDPPAVLSYGLWQRRFGGSFGALGKTIRIQGHTFVIVGVLPKEFNGLAADTSPDVRLPLRVWPVVSPGWAGHPEYVTMDVAGRLKTGVGLAKAEAETRTIWDAAVAALNRQPDLLGQDRSYPIMLDPLEHGTSILRDRYAMALKFLTACSAFLLLMICADVAGLLLARSAVRRQEIAVRLAVGATRARLAGQMLVESALLAALGAAGGIAIAASLAPVLSRLLPPIHDLGANRLALSLDIGVDRRVLLFSLAASAATVLLFGLAPAIAASRTSVDSILRSARSARSLRGRQALILIQVALCTVLLAGAGLLIRTFEDLRSQNPGFDPSRVVTFTIDPPVLYKPGESIEALRKETVGFFDTLQERLRDTPGVVSVALAEKGVLRDRGMGTTIARPGERPSLADVLAVGVNSVTPDYFQTMGMRLVSGRLLSRSIFDAPQKPEKVVVNRTFAERYFPGVDPIGKRFGAAGPGKVAPADSEIIGVVEDTKYRSLREPMQPMIFRLYRYNEGATVVPVRTHGKPDEMIQPLRQTLASFDSAMPIIEVDTLSDEVDASAAGERLTATLGSIFALLAVLLSAAGIYGLLAYAAAQRRREIGIRMAIGATPADIGALIGRQAVAMAAGGVVLGLGAARAAAPLIGSLLYNVGPSDIRSLGAAGLIVLTMAAFAAAIPAARAAHADPASALRED